MKVLVTGGYGMVGRSLQKIIKTLQHRDTFIFMSRDMCDLRDYQQVNRYFEENQPDAVIHLASQVGGLYANLNKNFEFLVDNIYINTNIVQACKRYKVKRLVNILSTCIFPDTNVDYPLTLEQLHNGLPHSSNIGYAFSKRMLHLSSQLLSEIDTKVINLIPANLYGEMDNYNLQHSHVIPALIHKVYLAKQQGTDLTLMGTGEAIRQFLYVDDLSRIILHFLYLDQAMNEISCIVSPPETHTISIWELAHTIAYLFGFTGQIICDTTSNNGQIIKTTSDKDVRTYLPNFQFTLLRFGLEKTIKFFIQHYKSVRK